MDEAGLSQRRNNLLQLFAKHSQEELKESPAHNDSPTDYPSSLSQLPMFSIMRQIAETNDELRTMKFSQESEQSLHRLQITHQVVENGAEFVKETRKCMEFLRQSSQVIERALKNPRIDSALPLPHHLHKKAVEMVEACAWLKQHSGWQPIDCQVEWQRLISKMKQEILHWEELLKEADINLQEKRLLRENTDVLLKNIAALDTHANSVIDSTCS